MKLVFGILSLVVVLAALAFVARTQLGVAGGGIVGRHQEAERQAGALAADPARAGSATAPATTVPLQARSTQDRARDNTVRALQQGADRNQRAGEP